MSAGFLPMDTAPRDGTAIRVEIPDHGSDMLVAFLPVGDEFSAWVSVTDDQDAPADWTDGICWSENAEGVPSAQPTGWKPVAGGKVEATVAGAPGFAVILPEEIATDDDADLLATEVVRRWNAYTPLLAAALAIADASDAAENPAPEESVDTLDANLVRAIWELIKIAREQSSADKQGGAA